MIHEAVMENRLIARRTASNDLSAFARKKWLAGEQLGLGK